ncbi:MAG: anthranilate phosphoribosyltransferase [Alphaproteobacteria bacterium]|nr:MAG: anthranilate phosphoribosyltransferase [Alphaproteobacteria bacterium]TAF14448.1 MAG: anthranilate phosphoribosyltransferase [Alphaproteobacteria bacterium]TAF39862.1 MAG: anthranilate phosphoribosyltransferase [Alphaproteobacteria bacterium]TAF77602.1 MAG: anthranilate phosphoribosyltransferase [Alphaproteobacteria bacterium]
MGSNHIQDILTELACKRDLSLEMAERAFHIIMSGGATPAQMGAFLMGLRQKGETVIEIAAGVRVLRHKAHCFHAPDDAIDTCGTGGDGKHTYNISTTVAIVVAAAGVPVVKHGNRAVTSASGSSDVLRELGLNIEAAPEQSEQVLRDIGLCFLMAPMYHKAMRHIAPVRQELGLRTIFNLIGPLANPARTKRQLLGVYSRQWLRPLAEVLHYLGTNKAWIVHGHDGMDELTTMEASTIVELHHGSIREWEITPEMFGIERPDPAELTGGLAEVNARALRDVLHGKRGAYRDIVLLNSAAALCVADKVPDMHQGMSMAANIIDSGAAHRLLADLCVALGGAK